MPTGVERSRKRGPGPRRRLGASASGWPRGGDEVRTLGAAIRKAYNWDEHIRIGAAHARSVSDAIARGLVLAGTVADVVDTVRRLERAGVTHVIPLLMGANRDATLEAFGREIIPGCRPSLTATRE